MKVKVNQDACIGCGACEQIDDEIFKINDAGLSEVIVEEVSTDKEENAKEAIDACPTSAIEEM